MFRFLKLISKNKETTAGAVLYQNKEWFFKISNKIDFAMKHEYIIYNDCARIKNYCRNFPRRAKLVQIETSIDFYKNDNPFIPTPGEKLITIDCLLVEYIEGITLAAAANRLHPVQFKSIISQLLIALKIAAGALAFTHYDLHFGNIILKQIEEECIEYNFLDKKITLKTFGILPIIIDFSYSYTAAAAGKNLCANLSMTNINYMSIVEDHDSDFRMLLPEKFPSHRITLNYPSIMDYILFSLKENATFSSILFDKNRYMCVDIIKYLIILPARENNYGNISLHYSLISDEFKKIEDISSCGIINLIILKYITRAFSKQIPFEQQRQDIFSYISSFGKFHYPKLLNLEILKEQMFLFSNCIEGIIFEYLTFSGADIEAQRKSPGEINRIINDFIV